MLMEELQRYLLLPDKEILINKTVKTSYYQFTLAGLTSSQGRNTLWVFCRSNEERAPKSPGYPTSSCSTNRQELIDIACQDSDLFFISALIIQGKRMTFSSSESGPVKGPDPRPFTNLQHFIDKGLAPEDLGTPDLSGLMLLAFRQTKGEEFPALDAGADSNITLTVEGGTMKVLINQPLTLKFGGENTQGKISFYDSYADKERFFYVNSLKEHDIWSSEEISGLQIDPTLMPALCPKDKILPLLEYETEENFQLWFYTKDYLEKSSGFCEEEEADCGIAGAVGVIWSPDENTGPHGLKNHICQLPPMERGHCDEIEAELFSLDMHIPEETIHL